jgi:hypothetical protein
MKIEWKGSAGLCKWISTHPSGCSSERHRNLSLTRVLGTSRELEQRAMEDSDEHTPFFERYSKQALVPLEGEVNRRCR